MKKLFYIVIFFAFCGSLAFTDNGEQEEVDYLLFALNSSSQFENERQASIQLDNLADYLKGKNLSPFQIIVYGYSAFAANDIDPLILSRERALFVINELQKRGVSRELFSDPVGYGSVDLWGSNTTEEDKIPNRRVRIVLDGNVITPVTIQAIEPIVEPIIEPVVEPVIESPIAEKEAVITQESPQSKQKVKFPWWLILLALLAIIAALLLSKLRKKPKTAKPVTEEKPVIIAPIAAPVAVAVAVTSETIVNLDEEILFRSYELYLERNGQSEDRIVDWYTAVQQICAKYEADGYQTYAADGSWWARRTVRQ
jgi:hypothetical protein